MNINKRLAAQFASVVAVAMLFGTSAFAETRHHDETNRSGDRQERHHRDNNNTNGANQSTVQPDQFRGSNRTNETRTYDRNRNNNNNNNRGNESRTYDRSRENRSYSQNSTEWRGGNRDYRNNNTYRNNSTYRNNNNYRGNDGNRGNRYYTHGRINRIERWNGGYRVYLGGALYPFFVPEARFRLGNWRVGIDIGLGGYYNPLGYYDYYDDAYYDGGAYYGGAAVSSGALRGVVETVDYRRGTFVLRDDISGNFVTVVMRGGDRRFDTLRPGDYVDVAGDWSRNGLFEAYRADLLEGGGNYRR